MRPARSLCDGSYMVKKKTSDRSTQSDRFQACNSQRRHSNGCAGNDGNKQKRVTPIPQVLEAWSIQIRANSDILPSRPVHSYLEATHTELFEKQSVPQRRINVVRGFHKTYWEALAERGRVHRPQLGNEDRHLLPDTSRSTSPEAELASQD